MAKPMAETVMVAVLKSSLENSAELLKELAKDEEILETVAHLIALAQVHVARAQKAQKEKYHKAVARRAKARTRG
jgi:hypothetical protein